MFNFIKNIFSREKFLVFKSPKNGQYYFTLKAKNGEPILRSEGYASLQGAMNGIKSVSANGIDPSNFQILESKDNKYYFTLKAKNGEIIGISETYNQKNSAMVGIESVGRCCQTENIKIK